MWRSVSVIILLLVASPALAGQASTVIHVGITITGTPQTPAKAKASGSSAQAMAISPTGTRAAAVKRPVLPRPRPPQ